MTQLEMQTESLERAENGASTANYAAIVHGFVAMGIAAADITPRENVFTFNAWLAKGRAVKKGQHGVKIQTVIDIEEKETREKKGRMRKFTTVFHISQTEDASERQERKQNEPRETPILDKTEKNWAERYRRYADVLQARIDHATRPMTQNPTPKRNRQYAERMHEGRNMIRQQKALRAIGDCIDAGTLPHELSPIVKKDGSGIGPLVHKGLESVSYYIVREANDYAVTTPAARKLQAMIEDRHDDDRHARELKIQEAEAQLMFSHIPGFFPTPRGLAEMMVEIADIKPGTHILEPSAGNGHIADAAKAAGAIVDVCEVNNQLRAILELKGYLSAGVDFMRDPTPTAYYDAVLMNPPFENQQDIDHIRHAYQFLKPDGVLVAILGPSFEFRDNAKSREFLAWLQEVGASWDEIPAGAFKESGTMVASRIMVIDKKERE